MMMRRFSITRFFRFSYDADCRRHFAALRLFSDRDAAAIIRHAAFI